MPAFESAEPFDPFYWCLTWLLRWEGGFVDDPADHGGATNMGITQATFDAWLASEKLPPTSVRFISLEQARAIYRTRYWDAVNGDEIARVDSRMALCVFDAAVHSGIRIASRCFQLTVQNPPDGIIGRATLAQYRYRRSRVGDRLLLQAFMERRRGYFAAIVLRDPTQRKFTKGWKARRNSLRQMIGLDPEEE